MLPAMLICSGTRAMRACAALLATGVMVAGTLGCAPTYAYRSDARPAATVDLRGAPEEGQYNLYAAGDAVPAHCAMLLRGEPIGFRRDPGSGLVAVAGRDRFPLDGRPYAWRLMRWPEADRPHLSAEVADVLLIVFRVFATMVAGLAH